MKTKRLVRDLLDEAKKTDFFNAFEAISGV